MEQLIPIIKFLKKNQFWLTCGAISIAALVTWFLATSALHKDKLAQQTKINGMISNANNVINTGATGVEAPVAHPNDGTKRGMEQEISRASAALLKAWKIRRDAQEDVLKWPEISSANFVNTFSQLLPAEKYMDQLAAVNWESQIAVYRTEIPEHMEGICEIIGAEWQFGKDASDDGSGDGGARQGDVPSPTSGGGDRGGGRGGATADTGTTSKEPGVVIWSRDNQRLWNDKLTQFKGRDGQDSNSGEPTPIQVIALQQDLWLLEALYKTIKEVNGDANANDLAVIKEIHHVVVGREARSQLGTLKEPNSLLAPPEPVTENQNNQNVFGNNNNNEEQEKPFDPNPGEGLAKYGPFHGRYVDADFKPIPAKKLFDVLNSEELPEEYLELLVAKRVPVRIAVRMDSQKIDDFIAACGNSSFAFEVWQVRIDRPRGSIQSAAVAEDGTMVQPTPSDGAQGGRGGDQRGGEESTDDSSGGAAPTGDGTQVHLRTTSDVDVEFYGIVKIYNPVNEKVINAAANKDNSANPNPNPNPKP